MKIVFDTEKNTVKVGTKTYGVDMKELKEKEVNNAFWKFLHDNTNLSLEEESFMFMSYRYAIGRKSIGSQSLAGDIKKYFYGRMTDESSIFTAFDMNREVESCLHFNKLPKFWFPITSLNSIYTSALDIFCQFVEDFNIHTKEELLKYKDVHIKLADNERGYRFEVYTWDEYIIPQVIKMLRHHYNNEDMTDEFAINLYNHWKDTHNTEQWDKTLESKFNNIVKDIPDPEYVFMSDIDALFVWNDLIHIFDKEHHHKSILIDGTECEWVWSYTHDTYQKDNNTNCYYQKEIGYKRIRIPINKWNGISTIYIPDENIKEDIY